MRASSSCASSSPASSYEQRRWAEQQRLAVEPGALDEHRREQEEPKLTHVLDRGRKPAP